MSKHLQLHIPVPCHESWNNMSLETEGRFCSSCQKTVIDFTAMSDQEIIQYFKNAKGNTCGRFSEDQLDKSYTLHSEKRLNWFKYFIQVLIPTVLITAKSYSQGEVKAKPLICNSPIKPDERARIRLGGVSSVQPVSVVYGKVTNKEGQALEGASVFIKGAGYGMAADKNGVFVLSAKNKFPLTISISYVGYETGEVAVDEKKAESPLNIVLNESTMGEVVVISYGTIKCRGIMGDVYSGVKVTAFDDFKRRVVDTFKISSTKIYPNPLPQSSLLTLEFPSKAYGNYTIIITDANGRNQQIEKFNVQSARIQKQIRLNDLISAGTYFVSLYGPGGKRVSSQKFVVMH
jgi:hypothetical protein